MLIVYARFSTGVGRSPLSLRDRLRWWSFFVAKAVLLLGLHWPAGLDQPARFVDLRFRICAAHDQRRCSLALPDPFDCAALLGD